MSKRIFQQSNWTPTATADTIALANGTYMALKGGNTTQLSAIEEIQVAGLAAVNSPTILQFARTSVLGITPTALAAPASDGPLHPSADASAFPVVAYTAAATGPQRSALTTLARLMVNINAWGGIMRWVASQDEQFFLLGNAVNAGEGALSAFTGGTVGAISSHIAYETL